MRSLFKCRRAAGPLVLALLGLAVAVGPARAQDFSKYHNYTELVQEVRSLVDGHRNLARLEAIGKSLGGRDIWVIEIANPAGVPLKDRPALLVAANFEGGHLFGSEIALFVADYLLKNYPADADIKQRLDNAVVYIIPRVNPDGAEAMFDPVQAGVRTNANPFDNDNDGRVDEDGPEDLNKDGQITVMRVEASDGEYMIDPGEKRLMKRADPKKGETGVFKLFWEGIDNDGDGFINEDPVGGIDLNRNFQHEYPYYTPDAGPHMVSERESRALMDWLLDHRNVAAILTFGESDNLIVPPTSAGRLGQARELDLVRFADSSIAGARTTGMIQTGGAFGRRGMRGFSLQMLMGGRQRSGTTAAEPSGRPRRADRSPETAVNSADVDYFKAVSDKYIELTGIREPLFVREPKGAFFQYGYFQFGIPSFSTPGFGAARPESPMQRRRTVPSQTGEASTAPPGRGSGDVMAMMMAGGNPQLMQMRQAGGRSTAAGAASRRAGGAAAPGIDGEILKWMDGEKIDGFVDWTKFDHPDLGEVEIGGFKPYAVTNPPPGKIASLGASHAKFVVHLASLFPKVKISNTNVTNHGGGLFRIEAEVENTGFLPTALAHAVTSRSVKPTMVQLGVKPDDIISGNGKTNFIQALDGSGSKAKFEWLIQGKSGQVVELVVVSQKGGSDSVRISLK